MSDDSLSRISDESMRELARLREQLEDSCEGGPMYHAPNSSVTVELLDQGMIVSYHEPVKRTRMVGSARMDSTTQILIQMLPQIMDNFPGQEDEEWNEKKERRKSLMRVGMEKALEALKPKAVEEWVWEQRRIVASDDKAFMAAIEKAKQAMAKAKEITSGGEFIRHSGYGTAVLGDYVAASPAVTMPPPLFMGYVESV